MAALNPDGTPKSMMQIAAEELARQNTVTPTLTNFDESKGVAGRAASIIGADSPLMQQAATRGTQLAAQRGLTNSSLAAEASQNAVLNAAVPIATADASLFNQGLLANQQAGQQAAVTNAQMGVQAGLQGMQTGESARQADTAAGLERQKLDINQSQFGQTLAANQGNFSAELAQRGQQFEATKQQQLVMQNMDLASRERMVGIEAQYKTELQGSVNISSSWQKMMDTISAIQNNSNLDPAARQTLIENNLQQFQSFAQFWKKTQPAGTDISALLDFGVGVAAPTPPTQPAGAAPYSPGFSNAVVSDGP